MSHPPSHDDLRASATHVLLTAPGALDQSVVDLDDDVEHHLRRVLRLRDGETVTVTDGAGRWRMCVVTAGPTFGLEATTDIVTDAPLTDAIVCNADLWASCIGGAALQSSYLDSIAEAGLDVVTVRDNPYHFLSEQALGASRRYGVKSISLLAVRR